MKSTIRSKLFLLVYGIILAFIAGLIIINNTFLEKYYLNNRVGSLAASFSEIKDIDLDSPTLDYEIQRIENEYSLNVQILQQVDEFADDYVWSDFDHVPDIYDRVYGDQFGIPQGIMGKIIYDFNQQLIGEETDYATRINLNTEGDYTAYLMDVESEFNQINENSQMMALVVAVDTGDAYDTYYVMTITFQSVTDSIGIFNSFTIIVGFFFMILAFIIMYFISYSFTNPILEINRIAEEISNLDFSNRVKIKNEDEFGDLGDSINRMSTQLEMNINELQKTNDKLAKEILEKTDIDKMRREFIASASHELKTPLSLIMGYSEALKLPDIDQDVKNEYLNIILDETNKMNKLVMDLLKLSQIESGYTNIELQEINIKTLLEETVNMFGLVIKDKNIKLKLDLFDHKIMSDYDQLRTVLTNFINNAINHVDENLTIAISMKTAKNRAIKVSVFNTGVNIPEADVKNIWDSFYKVDKSRTRAYGGQGLGLSICRTTLDLLGYKYGVNNLDDGVEFYFEIL